MTLSMEQNWRKAPGFYNVFTETFLKTQPEDTWGNQYFHISDAQACGRKIWYRIMLARDPDLYKAWDFQEADDTIEQVLTFGTGHAMHGLLQDHLVKHMAWCAPEDIEVPLRLPHLNMKGSVDAVAPVERYYQCSDLFGIGRERTGIIPGSHFVVDVKTKGDEVKSKWSPREGKTTTRKFPDDIINYPDAKYFVQLQCYMTLLPRLYPERYPDVQRGYLLYVCKNDGRVFCIGVDKDDSIWDGIEQKAIFVMDCVERQIPPPRDYSRSHRECRGTLIDGSYKYACQYQGLCWNDACANCT